MPVDGQQVVHQIYLKNLHMYTYDIFNHTLSFRKNKNKTISQYFSSRKLILFKIAYDYWTFLTLT